MTSPLRIVITQGHRNTSGGNSEERARTPAIANAITRALIAAGHEAICLQNDDGLNDDWFEGTLDAVAKRVMWYHRQRAVDLLLDIHIEGDRANTPGFFAILPDGTLLKTLTAFAGKDRATAGSRDYRIARAMAHAIARTTGLQLRRRGVLEPGVMSEQGTHVGGDLGWRLAMFGYTAPARDRMTRIVLECGNLVADAAIIKRQGFSERVAEGVVAGIAESLPTATTPVFPPFGSSGELTHARSVRVTASTLRIRKSAETDQEVIATLAAGSEFPVSGWIIGENVEGNPVWWITGRGERQAPRWRMWSGGTDLAGIEVLALPRK